MGWSLKQMLTPPKSIRKFQPKKLGNASWWKDFAGEVALPAAGALTGAGLLGLGGPLSGLSGIGGSIGNVLQSGVGKLGSAGSLLNKLGIGDGDGQFGLGDITSTASNLLGGGGGGGGGGNNLLKLLGLVGGGKMLWDASKQSKKDAKMGRNLAQESLDLYRQGVQGAQDRYAQNAPLRDAYRAGAMNFSDPTNPFSRGGNIFSQFAAQVPGGVPSGGQGGGMPVVPPNIYPPPPGGGPPPGQWSGPAMSTGTPNSLLGSMLGGSSGPPAGRTASVKGGNVNRKQDAGRDEMDGPRRRE